MAKMSKDNRTPQEVAEDLREALERLLTAINEEVRKTVLEKLRGWNK